MKNLQDHKAVIFLFLLLFNAVIVFIVYITWRELNVYPAITKATQIISERGMAPALFFLIPSFVAICYFLYLRLRYTQPDIALINKTFSKAAKTLPILFAAMLIIPTGLDRYVEQKGYSFCRDYSPTRFGTPDVWLSDSSLCISKGRLVRGDLVKWMHAQQRNGHRLTQERVQQEIMRLVELLPIGLRGKPYSA